jgi:tetratricopeptide (TPR) repeat protein
LREFIIRAFSDDELEILCYDYFRDISDEFTARMTKGQKVQLLIQLCDRRDLMQNLLVALQRERPTAFAHYLSLAPGPVPATAQVAPVPAFAGTRRNPRQVFISYAHADQAVADQLAHDLRRSGWPVWMAPGNIRPGEKWVDAVQRGLDESAVFLLVLTNSSVRSRWVKTETSAAIAMEHEGLMRVILVEAEHCEVPTLWAVYQRVVVHGLLGEAAYVDGVRALLAVLANGNGGVVGQVDGLNGMNNVINANLTHLTKPKPARAAASAQTKTKASSKLNLNERRRRAERWQTRAYAHAAADNYKRAVTACAKALRYSPKPASVHADLARIHEQFGFIDLAIASWQAAVAQDDEQAPYFVRLARLYERADKPEDAIATYTQAIALRPDVAEYVFERGLLYERKHDGRAIADFNRAVQLDRVEPRYYVARAASHHGHGSYARAVDDYTAALNLQPDRAALWFARGNSHYCLGNYAKAIADYTRTIELERNNGEAYFWRGMAFKLSGESAWAQHDFQDALRNGYMLAANEVNTSNGVEIPRRITGSWKRVNGGGTAISR